MNAQDLSNNLSNFYGTEEYHRYSSIFQHVILTDGALYLAENAGAYWLMDLISSHLPKVKDTFAIITMKKDKGGATVAIVDDIPANKVWAQQHLTYTDFPLDEIKLYAQVTGGGKYWVIMLTSEY